eukprot:244132-Chlamydomonas_euryale.AAC.29
MYCSHIGSSSQSLSSSGRAASPGGPPGIRGPCCVPGLATPSAASAPAAPRVPLSALVLQGPSPFWSSPPSSSSSSLPAAAARSAALSSGGKDSAGLHACMQAPPPAGTPCWPLSATSRDGPSPDAFAGPTAARGCDGGRRGASLAAGGQCSGPGPTAGGGAGRRCGANVNPGGTSPPVTCHAHGVTSGRRRERPRGPPDRACASAGVKSSCLIGSGDCVVPGGPGAAQAAAAAVAAAHLASCAGGSGMRVPSSAGAEPFPAHGSATRASVP